VAITVLILVATVREDAGVVTASTTSEEIG
jgi:hypothetical protein